MLSADDKLQTEINQYFKNVIYQGLLTIFI